MEDNIKFLPMVLFGVVYIIFFIGSMYGLIRAFIDWRKERKNLDRLSFSNYFENYVWSSVMLFFWTAATAALAVSGIALLIIKMMS